MLKLYLLTICIAIFAVVLNATEFIPVTAVHTAFTGNPKSHLIQWHTQVNPSTIPTVYYSRNASFVIGDSSSMMATGTSTTYLQSAGYEHKVVLENLLTYTTYYYICGSKAGTSLKNRFVTAPNVGSTKNYKIAMFGDLGVKESENTINRLQERTENNDINWIYHIGDISYADDYNSNYYETVWNSWFALMDETMSRTTYMVCPGNHEYSCEEGGACEQYARNFTVYNARFQMPGATSFSNTSMFYSFDFASIHFVAISTETDYPDSPFDPVFGNQLAWLENDLKNAKSKDGIEWIIVVGHRPIYSSQEGFCNAAGYPIDQSKNVQNAFEALFHQYEVDLYVVGHVHSYERTYPVFQNEVSKNYTTPKYTTHIVAGGAGNKEGLSVDYLPDRPTWSANRFWTDQGYGILEFSPNSLTWQYFRSGDDGLQDTFTITK